ncbi:hypothetical protein [Nonomuraea turcica]|uniref:hypothetical protein n=1 Tax=Nonomuraea sp. G32 TaxID=3067274 RepID=UPI00273C01E9|nr:hypothetical protein [Nonomuraea sp. G32]MDP4507623.1 hypothetical protein [Nonomuraea sp. G32]
MSDFDTAFAWVKCRVYLKAVDALTGPLASDIDAVLTADGADTVRPLLEAAVPWAQRGLD